MGVAEAVYTPKMGLLWALMPLQYSMAFIFGKTAQTEQQVRVLRPAEHGPESQKLLAFPSGPTPRSPSRRHRWFCRAGLGASPLDQNTGPFTTFWLRNVIYLIQQNSARRYLRGFLAPGRFSLVGRDQEHRRSAPFGSAQMFPSPALQLFSPFLSDAAFPVNISDSIFVSGFQPNCEALLPKGNGSRVLRLERFFLKSRVCFGSANVSVSSGAAPHAHELL